MPPAKNDLLADPDLVVEPMEAELAAEDADRAVIVPGSATMARRCPSPRSSPRTPRRPHRHDDRLLLAGQRHLAPDHLGRRARSPGLSTRSTTARIALSSRACFSARHACQTGELPAERTALAAPGMMSPTTWTTAIFGRPVEAEAARGLHVRRRASGGWRPSSAPRPGPRKSSSSTSPAWRADAPSYGPASMAARTSSGVRWRPPRWPPRTPVEAVQQRSICSRWGPVKPRSVNWFGAFLYFPTPSNWACTPTVERSLEEGHLRAQAGDLEDRGGDRGRPCRRRWPGSIPCSRRTPGAHRRASERRKRETASRSSWTVAHPESGRKLTRTTTADARVVYARSRLSTSVRSVGGWRSKMFPSSVDGSSGISPWRSR